MKTQLEIYDIGASVWGVSEYLDSSKSTHHYAIYPAIVVEATRKYDTDTNTKIVEYWLKGPGNAEWGDSVNEEFVNEDFSVLVDKLKKIWIKNANS